MKVDHSPEQQLCTIKSDKMVSDILVRKKPADHHFFEVKFTAGATPSELSGRYSNIDSGVRAVESYLRGRRPTATVRRDEYSKERKKNNGSNNQTEGSKHIRKGSDN
mgnify:CR=1 FL=1